MEKYRRLLKKYMAHVGNEEGTHFIPTYTNDEWSPWELQQLVDIDKEILEEQPSPKTWEDYKRSLEWNEQVKALSILEAKCLPS